MKHVIIKSNSRGVADHGWLHSYHTFSFAGYFNPERMGFGALRVINDDIVKPSKGFGTHPHNDMEIISIPLQGSLKHNDTMGNRHVIKHGEVQIMSAGTGVAHSEYNNSDLEDVNFLQIWVLPKENGIKPSYDQAEFSLNDRVNKLQLVISPDARNGSLRINQDAFFSQVKITAGCSVEYKLYKQDNCVYIFLLEGQANIANQELFKRDGLGIVDATEFVMNAITDSDVLIMEIPR